MIRFDSHLHIGEVYYGKRAKSKQTFSVDEALEYFKDEEITHCNTLYTPESLSEVKELKRRCMFEHRSTIFPFKWVSWFDGREEEKFDVNFDRGIKLHPIRTAQRENKNLLDKDVLNYLEDLPEQTPIIIHTQDCRFEKDTSFFMVMRLAQLFPRLKFIIAHAGSAGPASRLPSNKILRERPKDGVNYIGMNILDSSLIYGALQCSFLMDNVYCDLSSLVPNSLKIQILGSNPHFLDKIMIGADKPFFKAVGIRDEEKQFKKFLGLSDDDISKLHQRALNWLWTYECGYQNYKEKNYNLGWVNNVVRTKRRWVYLPRELKGIV